jgi:hypothetical protein
MLPFVLECRVLILDDAHTFFAVLLRGSSSPQLSQHLPYFYLSLSSLCVEVLPTYMHTDRREG